MALDDPTREALRFLAWCWVAGTALGYAVDRVLAVVDWRRR